MNTMPNAGSFRKNSQPQQVAQPFPGVGGTTNFVESADIQALREEGNNLFRKGEYTQAVEVFTKALKIEPKNYLLWSNRAAAYISMKQFELALQDSDCCLHYAPPTFLKVYMRKGAALFGLGHFEEAQKAYRKGYADDLSDPALISRLNEIEAAKSGTKDHFAQGIQKLREGFFAEALVFFNQAFVKMPHNPELNAYRSACQGCVDTNRPDASVCLSGTLLTLKRLKLKKRWFSLQNTTFSYFNMNDMSKPPKFALPLFGARVTDVQGKVLEEHDQLWRCKWTPEAVKRFLLVSSTNKAKRLLGTGQEALPNIVESAGSLPATVAAEYVNLNSSKLKEGTDINNLPAEVKLLLFDGKKLFSSSELSSSKTKSDNKSMIDQQKSKPQQCTDIEDDELLLITGWVPTGWAGIILALWEEFGKDSIEPWKVLEQ